MHVRSETGLWENLAIYSPDCACIFAIRCGNILAMLMSAPSKNLVRWACVCPNAPRMHEKRNSYGKKSRVLRAYGSTVPTVTSVAHKIAR